MRTLGSSGLWELFMPGLPCGEYYKYEIRDQNGHIFTKQDPISKSYEIRPGTASRVTADLNFLWDDEEWMNQRSQTQPRSRLATHSPHLSGQNTGAYLFHE